MMIFWSILAFVLLLTVLVIVHELGHYLAAVFSGVTVEEFGFGIPPRIKKLFRYRGTVFSLNAIPFGGFVRLQGENSFDPSERVRAGSFASASIPARLLILVAGVFMNVVIAIMLYTAGFWLWHWVPTYLSLEALEQSEQRGEVQVAWKLHITDVVSESPAESAGVVEGAILLAVDAVPVKTPDDVLKIQEGKRSVRYTYLVSEEDSTSDSTSTVLVQLDEGKSGVVLSPEATVIDGSDRSLPTGMMLALRESWTVTVGNIQGIGLLLKSLVVAQKVPKDIAGIIGIAQLTHDSLQQGFMKYLRLVALLSLSLGVLNILPFPALDGGRMVFVLYELIARRPANRRVEMMTNGIGILLIMVLMVAVTWNDILRLLSA
ncbi:MAG TPA: site-2 protease family protein [Candidatus Peribacterales bacterium]|nr:site-2 protease family protein [Candidatus Peribacterales bacterium]